MSNELLLMQGNIENRIFSVRNVQIMLDFHLAELYSVETKRINEQVKRNYKRFPSSFMFQVTSSEWEIIQSQIAENNSIDRLQSQNATTKRRTLPYAFTEQGVAMLSSVLNSEDAINASIHIMNAFVKMRQILVNNSIINYRIQRLEAKQLETDQRFEQILKALDGNKIPTQGVFFEGQIFDAYELTSRIIRSAKKSIILIDNYIDEKTLVHLSKKRQGVEVILLTKNVNKERYLDVQKANEQYGCFKIKPFSKSHDRFLIIDGAEVFHLGASLKDLGKKWFAFSKMNKLTLENIINEIKEDLIHNENHQHQREGSSNQY